MIKRVLISTLGETPCVVTEAIDILKNEGKMVDEIFLITTSDPNTLESADLLKTHIPKYYKNKIIINSLQIDSYKDIINPKSARKFMKLCYQALGKFKNEDAEIYVCISGGRKTMSALITLAVQIYGANELFHLTIKDVDENLEKECNIKNITPIKKNIEILDRILHPPTEKINIIRMPYVGLFLWIYDLIKALKNEPVTDKKIIESLDIYFSKGETGEKNKKLLAGLLQIVLDIIEKDFLMID